MPENPSAATRADVFVEFLDHLGVETSAVMGISAETGAAVQLALRHPDKVSHLTISSGNWPGSPTSEAPPNWAKMFYNDPAMWLLRAIAPPMTAGLMGVPKGFPQDDQQAAYVKEMLDSIFPLAPRAEGAIRRVLVEPRDQQLRTGTDHGPNPDHPHQRRPARRLSMQPRLQPIVFPEPDS